jgi:hypothetical protein
MLMSWSSPFPEETPIKQRPRQKIVSTKQLETEDDPLSNYTPPPKPEPLQRKVPESNRVEPDSMPNVYDTPLMDTTYKSNETELLEKLNYMISLLEEQRDEKTGQVTEELILYVFLGVFTLFVLDTFVKNGKYSR